MTNVLVPLSKILVSINSTSREALELGTQFSFNADDDGFH